MTRAVVFDLDGTLVDSRPGIEWAVRRALAEVAPEAELDPGRSFIGPPLPELLRRALPGLGEERRAEVARLFRPLYDGEGWRRTTLFPDVPELLGSLADRAVPVHVVTNKPVAPTASILGLEGLQGRIASARSPDSVEPRHPDKAAMLGATLAEARLAPAEVVVVGDDADDRRAAQATGCAFLAVGYGYGDAAATALSDDIGCAASVADVRRILDEWLAS